MNELLDFVNTNTETSNEVKNNAILIINSLSNLFISTFNIDDIYVSSYKTIIIEHITGKNIFSIEIGKYNFGYFSMIDDKTIHFVESEDFNDGSIKQMNLDFEDYKKRLS
jgi:hypothetical protein